MNIKKTVATALVGLTLVAGGTAATMANWQVDDAATLGTIRTGRMAVSLSEATRWLEVRSQAPWPEVDLASFRMVPGDTIRAEMPIRAELEGQNLRAVPSFDIVAGEGAALDVRHLGGNQWRVTQNGADTAIRISLAASQFGPEFGEGVHTASTWHGGITMDVVFERGNPTEADMEVVANLGALQVTLNQVR